MKIKADIILNLKLDEARKQVEDAGKESLKDVTVDIANDAIKGSPKLTGNNARSIKYEIKKNEASIFSTSGYGGFLETGTVKMAARPYFKPALDKNIGKLAKGIKSRLT
ncbi:MAG: hypothetical protein KAR06_04995 [Deltaproteobacteria bacterium]|nr:hypothetical protein [Deltaproteobacteria bacterium]